MSVSGKSDCVGCSNNYWSAIIGININLICILWKNKKKRRCVLVKKDRNFFVFSTLNTVSTLITKLLSNLNCFIFYLFLKRLYGYLLQCCQPCGFLRFLPIFVYEKTETRWQYIYCTNECEKFFLKFPYIFSETTSAYIFYKLYKFMKICYNCFQHLFEFHQIIKHFYNFLKGKYMESARTDLTWGLFLSFPFWLHFQISFFLNLCTSLMDIVENGHGPQAFLSPPPSAPNIIHVHWLDDQVPPISVKCWNCQFIHTLRF